MIELTRKVLILGIGDISLTTRPLGHGLVFLGKGGKWAGQTGWVAG
ncbi:hypothetical protein Hdeb2414_s0014g00423891 [Helianthus debilis subsp. tardiflorus]